ncbi:MAG: undecaprenyl-diphosphate phosphatase [Thermomicrobiales bacterium]
MELIHAIVLGLVQGLGEFLPISSSAHLIIVPWLLGWESPGIAFDAALHLGTLCAVLIYFFKDLIAMAMALPKALMAPIATLRAQPGHDNLNGRLALLIAIGTIPGAVAGLLGESALEGFYHGAGGTSDAAIVAIAFALILLGALLWLAERTATHTRLLASLRLPDTVIIGLAQALALVPGVSRSGSTLTAGLFRNLARADAARFSFLLGVPIIAVAGLKGVLDILDAGVAPGELGVLLVGMAVAGVSGYLAIWGLLRYLQRASTEVFIAYRFILGTVLIVLVITGLR